MIDNAQKHARKTEYGCFVSQLLVFFGTLTRPAIVYPLRSASRLLDLLFSPCFYFKYTFLEFLPFRRENLVNMQELNEDSLAGDWAACNGFFASSSFDHVLLVSRYSIRATSTSLGSAVCIESEHSILLLSLRCKSAGCRRTHQCIRMPMQHCRSSSFYQVNIFCCTCDGARHE